MDLVNSKLFILFSCFSENELKDLKKAVHSPFFNKRSDEKKLFDYLLQSKKNKNKSLDPKAVYYAVFGSHHYEMAKLRHVMSYLTKIFIRFMSFNEFEQNQEQKLLSLVQSLRKRNVSKCFLSEYETANAYYQKKSLLGPDIYYYNLKLHTEYYAYSIKNRKAKNQELETLSNNLDAYYVIEKLKHACNILSYKNMFNFDHQPELINEAISLIKRKDELNRNPYIRLLFYSYQCLKEPDNESHFEALKPILLTSTNKIELAELKDIFTLAINYCIKQLNTGEKKYYHEVFELYKAGIENRIFEESGKLSHFTYKNIASIAIGLGEYEWVKHFIKTYRHKLDERYRDGFFAYCMSRYYFSIGHYEIAADELKLVEIKEQFTDLDARILLIKIYFELDEFDLTDYSLNNLKQQIKRKKLKSYHEKIYKNFAKFFSQLLNLKPYDKKARQTLINRIKTEAVIAEKNWLLEKIVEKDN